MLPKSVFKTCPKCEKVSERSSSRTLHSTLAYSKCRCHRMLQYRLEQYKAQALETRKKKELVPKSTPLPHTSLHPTPSPPSPKLPHLHQVPNAPRKHNRACSQSQRTLCSPKHSFVTNTSPQASCRLPTIAWYSYRWYPCYEFISRLFLGVQELYLHLQSISDPSTIFSSNKVQHPII